MAITLQGPNGGWKNKFGKTVGFKWKSLFVFRDYVGENGSNTPKQAEQRSKFAFLGRMAGNMLDAIRIGLHTAARKNVSTETGEFVRLNSENVTIHNDVPEVTYEKVQLTTGHLTGVGFDEPDLENPLKIDVSISESYTGAQGTTANDKVYVAVYNKTLKSGMLSDGTAKRTSDKVEISVPTFWQGTQVEMWGFVKAAETSVKPWECSETMYLGSGTIA